MALFPCSSCARHVRSDEVECPFCGEALAAPAPNVETGHMAGRAAIVFAAAAATAIAVTGCGKTVKSSSSTSSSTSSSGGEVSSSGASGAGEASSGMAVALYGPPPQYDEMLDASLQPSPVDTTDAAKD